MGTRRPRCKEAGLSEAKFIEAMEMPDLEPVKRKAKKLV
jgi:hypothetical protein